MVDKNLHDFYGRVARIEHGRAQGYAFEAQGTLGLSHYRKQVRRQIPVVGPLLLILAMGIAVKGTIHYKVGAATYDQRIAILSQGEGFDRLGGWLMQADPATLWVSGQVAELAHPTN